MKFGKIAVLTLAIGAFTLSPAMAAPRAPKPVKVERKRPPKPKHDTKDGVLALVTGVLIGSAISGN